MDDDAEKGPLDAHTPRKSSGKSGKKSGKKKADQVNAPEIELTGDDQQLAAAVQSLRHDLEDEPEQLDLVADDIEPVGSLELIAENSNALRRARERGRPKGALNKRNDKVFDYLEACGHRDPVTTLSLLQSADTRALATALGMKTKEILAEQVKAAVALLPYKYAKKPVDLNVNDKRQRPIMVIGQMNNMMVNVDDDGLRSAGQPRKQTIENNE